MSGLVLREVPFIVPSGVLAALGTVHVDAGFVELAPDSAVPIDHDGMLDRWFVSDMVRRHGISLQDWDECIPVQQWYVADAVFAALGY